jgi:hypothetical protein
MRLKLCMYSVVLALNFIRKTLHLLTADLVQPLVNIACNLLVVLKDGL